MRVYIFFLVRKGEIREHGVGFAFKQNLTVEVSAWTLTLYHKTLKEEFCGQLSKKIQPVSKNKQLLGDLNAKVCTEDNS